MNHPRRSAQAVVRWTGAIVLALLLATPAAAYYHYVHYIHSGSYEPAYEKFDLRALIENTVQVHVTNTGPQTGGNDSFPSVLSQVKQAAAVWNSVSDSKLRVAFGGLQSPERQGHTPGILVQFVPMPPGVLAEAAPTVSLDPANGPDGAFFPITGSIVLMNRDTSVPPGPSYAETYFTTAVHELGHALGLQHTFTSSAMSQAVVRNTTRTAPLGADDVAALARLYGRPGWTESYGSISGQVTLDGAGVSLASVVALPAVGQPVSALTNPDGSYRIDGLPPGQYLLYVHPLPPDADVTNPVDAAGTEFAPGEPFGASFFAAAGAGTRDPALAETVQVDAGQRATGMNFAVTPRSAVPIYDVVTFSYFDSASQSYSYTGAPVTPAFVSSTQTATGGVATVTFQSAAGITPLPRSAALLGGIGASRTPAVCCNSQAVALYFDLPPSVAAGPRHLVLDFGDDMYVLPNAVVVVNDNPPAIASIAAGTGGGVTVYGTNLRAGSRIFFDGLEAAVRTPFSGGPASGAITVAPPPGFSGQKASVVVYNGDWQSSITLDAAALAYGSALPNPPPTYTYPAAPAPHVTAVPLALPAGVASRVDVTATDMNFVDGQVTLGFGTSDVAVRRIWVLSPTHLVANVVTAADGVFAASQLNVISGFQVDSQANAFQLLAANPAMPYLASIANGIGGQSTVYGHSYASIDGANLGMSRGSVRVTVGGEQAPVVYGSWGLVNFLVPGDVPAGLADLALNNGMADSPPLAVEFGLAPPVIVGIALESGQPLDSYHPATVGSALTVLVAGLDPAVADNVSRLRVTLGAVAMPVMQLTPQAGGLYAIRIQLAKPPTGYQVPLAVWMDGSSWSPIPIPVFPPRP